MNNFDDIRPYTDAEVPAALQRLTQAADFPQALRFIYPNADIEPIKRKLTSVNSIHELQASLMNDAICRIIQTTTDGFTYSGLQHLRRGAAYLFVSNHRDITLDAFLLQHLLLEHRDETSYIVFGNNLLEHPIIEDVFRCNKLIPMARGGTPRAFYESLRHLSDYIRHLVVDQQQSVWIAQKNGRAKDGVDTTAPAVIKMLTLSGNGNPTQALADLHIVPVSISYEWDPCDLMKANELYLSRNGGYQKAKHEDTKSVVTGIIGPKGKVHLTIGRPLKRSDFQAPEGVDFAEHAAAVLDRHIQSGYKLMPTNYVAYNLLTGHEQYGRYKERTRSQFLQRLDMLPHPDMRQIMIETYAAPVISAKRMKN